MHDGSLFSLALGTFPLFEPAGGRHGGPGRRTLYTHHTANRRQGSRPVSGGGMRERERRLRRMAARMAERA